MPTTIKITFVFVFTVGFFTVSPQLRCQQRPTAHTAQNGGPQRTHQTDFDYLLGDWDFTSTSKQYGTFHGTWSAMLVGDGHVLDEYRVLGDNGTVYYSVLTIRAYDRMQDRWDLVSLGPGNGLRSTGTGRREGDDVHIEQRFLQANDSTEILRIRYHHISADGFLWSADRSLDNGKTWESDFQVLQAKRRGPPRSAPLLLLPR